MEITNSTHVEIFHTIEKIERMNKAVAFHKAMENPDQLAIQQYIKLKKQLTKQLLELLDRIDLRLQMAA